MGRGQADYAISEWTHFFRGEPRVKNDRDVTAADLTGFNIVLFGDPSSNAIYKRMANSSQSPGVPAASSSVSIDSSTRIMRRFVFPDPLRPPRSTS